MGEILPQSPVGRRFETPNLQANMACAALYLKPNPEKAGLRAAQGWACGDSQTGDDERSALTAAQFVSDKLEYPANWQCGGTQYSVWPRLAVLSCINVYQKWVV